jgi:hypothetical protein
VRKGERGGDLEGDDVGAVKWVAIGEGAGAEDGDELVKRQLHVLPLPFLGVERLAVRDGVPVLVRAQDEFVALPVATQAQRDACRKRPHTHTHSYNNSRTLLTMSME